VWCTGGCALGCFGCISISISIGVFGPFQLRGLVTVYQCHDVRIFHVKVPREKQVRHSVIRLRVVRRSLLGQILGVSVVMASRKARAQLCRIVSADNFVRVHVCNFMCTSFNADGACAPVSTLMVDGASYHIRALVKKRVARAQCTPQPHTQSCHLLIIFCCHFGFHMLLRFLRCLCVVLCSLGRPCAQARASFLIHLCHACLYNRNVSYYFKTKYPSTKKAFSAQAKATNPTMAVFVTLGKIMARFWIDFLPHIIYIYIYIYTHTHTHIMYPLRKTCFNNVLVRNLDACITTRACMHCK
jgi:hypothetical protein